MMDITDAKKVIENLQTRSFICSDDSMVLDNGYVVMWKGDYDSLTEKQTPKKPEFIHMLGDRTYKAKCTCGRVFMANIDIESNPKYCSGCGQAFDWSDQ